MKSSLVSSPHFRVKQDPHFRWASHQPRVLTSSTLLDNVLTLTVPASVLAVVTAALEFLSVTRVGWSLVVVLCSVHGGLTHRRLLEHSVTFALQSPAFPSQPGPQPPPLEKHFQSRSVQHNRDGLIRYYVSNAVLLLQVVGRRQYITY